MEQEKYNYNKEDIYNFIKTRPGTSFVELQRRFDKDGGEQILFFKQNENIVLWSGMSKDVASKVIELVGSGLIRIYSGVSTTQTFLCYVMDGKVLGLPCVSKKEDLKSKKEMWLPVLLYTSEEYEKITKRFRGKK